MNNTPSNRNDQTASIIDKRDFDANRRLPRYIGSGEGRAENDTFYSRPGSRRSRHSGGNDDGGSGSDDGLLNDVAEGIVERDRRKMEKEFARGFSFCWGICTW